MKARIAAAEAKEVEEANRLEEAAQAARNVVIDESQIEESQVHGESDEDADVPGESDAIRALKVRPQNCPVKDRCVDVNLKRS